MMTESTIHAVLACFSVALDLNSSNFSRIQKTRRPKTLFNIYFYPSWPKSWVNFFSLSRSSSFTVGLVFASELSMSPCTHRRTRPWSSDLLKSNGLDRPLVVRLHYNTRDSPCKPPVREVSPPECPSTSSLRRLDLQEDMGSRGLLQRHHGCTTMTRGP